MATAALLGLLAAAGVAWWLSGTDPAPSVEADRAVDGVVDVPTAASTTVDVEDAGVPVEILATCQGRDGATGCVRWVHRVGVLPRPGAGAIVTVIGDRLVALDPDTGAQRWTAGTTDPNGSPLVLGDHTVLLEDAGGVRAFDVADGDERWRMANQRLPATAPGQPEPSVVILADTENGTAAGVDVQDGTVQWTRTVGRAGDRPAFVVPLDDRHAVVGTLTSAVVVDVVTGVARWALTGVGGTSAETPVGVTSTHVVTLVDKVPSWPYVFRIRAALSGRITGEVTLPHDAHLFPPVLTGDLLVVRTDAGLAAHRLADGTVVWQRDDLLGNLASARPVQLAFPGPFGIRDWVATTTPVLVLVARDGTAHRLDPATGQTVLRFGDTDAPVWVLESFLAEDRLWRLSPTSLRAFDLGTGQSVLQVDVRASPTVVTTNPLVVATSGRLVRLDLDPPFPAGDPTGQ